MQNVGDTAFVDFAIEQAGARVRSGLPLRAVVDVVGYVATKPTD
jgi:hypothetical protein